MMQLLRCWLGIHARYDGVGHCMICGAAAIPCADCGHDHLSHDTGEGCDANTNPDECDAPYPCPCKEYA